VLDDRMSGQRPAAPPPSTAPVPIERGTALVVLARVVDGRLERLRTIDDACPIDAGGRGIRWLTGITPVASVEYLDGLTRAESLSVGTTRRIAEAAVSAIGLHDTPTAMATLDRLITKDANQGLRRHVVTVLASARGRAGFERVKALISGETDNNLRQHAVSALAQSPEPAVADTLLSLARTDKAANVRAEAASRYVRRVGPPAIETSLKLLENETDDGVRRRIVSAIGSLPNGAGTPSLIQLARTHTNLHVRKEAVAALGRSSDPSARGVLEELLK
jgi:HEAT repeat protein